MANVLISGIAGTATSFADADLMEMEQGTLPGSTSAKVQIAELRKYMKRVAITTKTGSATLALTDGDVVEMDVAGANNLTVPPNSTVAFPIGTVKNVVNYGAGQTTIVAGAGVSIRTPATLKARAQYSTLVLIKRATDEWVLAGDLEP